MGCNASMVDTHGTTSGKSDKELAVKHFSSGMYVCMYVCMYAYESVCIHF
jgi:hypothetical protein